MKIEGHQIPKSSFLSIEKDAAIIINNLMKNERLKRLLYYTTPDALDRPNISDAETIELIKKMPDSISLEQVLGPVACGKSSSRHLSGIFD